MSDQKSLPAETKSTGAANAPDSLAAAASAFQNRLFPPQGQKRKPEGEVSTPEPEPEVETTDDVVTEEPEAEEATEEPETSESPADEMESEPEQTDEVEADETDAPPPKRSRKLKFSDGTESDVTEDEAYQGYLRGKDYTQKSQANAELRKQLEAERETARASAARHAEELASVKAAMDKLVPKEPNWTELRKNLSAEDYANVVDEYKAFKAERDRVEAEAKKVAEEQAKDYEKAYLDWRKDEFEKLRAAVPEWVDPKRGAADAGEMAKYMLSIGYRKEEVDAAVDHRFLVMLRKAWLYDTAQKAGKTKVEPIVKAGGKIKSAPPGGKVTPPTPKSEIKRAQETLRKEGSLKAAASVFDNLLKRGSGRR